MINVLLCLIKYVAFIYSRSYVVLASAVDSTMDLVSGGVLFCQAKAAALDRTGRRCGTSFRQGSLD